MLPSWLDRCESRIGKWREFRHRARRGLAEEENIAMVNLEVQNSAYFTSIGPDATLALYTPGDTPSLGTRPS